MRSEVVARSEAAVVGLGWGLVQVVPESGLAQAEELLGCVGEVLRWSVFGEVPVVGLRWVLLGCELVKERGFLGCLNPKSLLGHVVRGQGSFRRHW